MLPATASRFWSASVTGQMIVAAAIGLVSSYVGLLISFHQNLPASPAIILSASVIYALSVIVGRIDSVVARSVQLSHHH